MTKIRVVWTVSYEGVADESVANTVDLEFEKMGLYMLMLEGQVRLENVNKESLMLRVDSGCDYDVCTENGKPIVYFFGSTSCPHCVWEKPVIGNTTALFASEISYHENMGTQTDLEVFQRYATYNRGSVPFIVIGCQFIRLGSGESMAADEATIKELNKTNPAIISESLSLYDEAISYSELAITAYQNNETIYLDYLDNYTALLQQSSEAIEKLVLTKLICNVTNNMPSSVCNI